MKTEELLDRLENVKKSGSGWSARCPAHDDNRNSLSVGEEDGKVLLYCHAGCSLDQIIKELGVSKQDLFPPPKRNGKRLGKVEAVYDYVDEEGVLLYQVVRYDPKDFRGSEGPSLMANGSTAWVMCGGFCTDSLTFWTQSPKSNGFTLSKERRTVIGLFPKVLRRPPILVEQRSGRKTS